MDTVKLDNNTVSEALVEEALGVLSKKIIRVGQITKHGTLNVLFGYFAVSVHRRECLHYHLFVRTQPEILRQKIAAILQVFCDPTSQSFSVCISSCLWSNDMKLKEDAMDWTTYSFVASKLLVPPPSYS